MNEKGEISLFCSLLIFVCMSLVLLCGLELRKSFKLLEKRTELFLCTKEVKGEFNDYMKFMGRSNWGIRNLNRASLIMIFIPGAQGAAMDAQKIKKYLQRVQNIRLISYLNSLRKMKAQGCPLDPRIYITPFKLSGAAYKRDMDGAVTLRNEKWTYYFFSKPYLLSLKVNAQAFESITPKIVYVGEEKGAMLSSLLSSR